MIIRNIVLLVVKYDHIWRMQWHPTPVLLPGKSHGLRSMVGCSPWGRWELDMTEQLHFHFSLSCFGEGNDNLLQYSCLENSRDWGAWWAAIYGVTKSQTQLNNWTDWQYCIHLFCNQENCFNILHMDLLFYYCIFSATLDIDFLFLRFTAKRSCIL